MILLIFILFILFILFLIIFSCFPFLFGYCEQSEREHSCVYQQDGPFDVADISL